MTARYRPIAVTSCAGKMMEKNGDYPDSAALRSKQPATSGTIQISKDAFDN